MAPSTPHVLGRCPTLSRIGDWPLAQVGSVFHGHCSTPVSDRFGNLASRIIRACTHLALRVVDVVRAVTGAPDNTAQSRRAHVRSCTGLTRPQLQCRARVEAVLPAPASAASRAGRASTSTPARHIGDSRPGACVCTWLGRGHRAGCSLSLAHGLLDGAVDDHARSIDRLEGLEVADERKHLCRRCRAPLLELKKSHNLLFSAKNFAGQRKASPSPLPPTPSLPGSCWHQGTAHASQGLVYSAESLTHLQYDEALERSSECES